MSQIKAAQFSEAEIAQIGKELKANQMTLEQAEPLALAKGMSATEFMQLKVRLQSNTTVPTEVKEEQKNQPLLLPKMEVFWLLKMLLFLVLNCLQAKVCLLNPIKICLHRPTMF